MFGLLVVFIMLIWPNKWASVFPSSLAGIIIALMFVSDLLLVPYGNVLCYIDIRRSHV